MIPKIIHYCWFGGGKIPEQVKQYIATWRKYCPDYEIKRWDESNFDVRQNAYCYEAWKAKKWAFVSDYARLKILYDHGGIYMDTDVEIVKNLDSLLAYNAFCGFESEQVISTGTIGSKRGNEWISYLLQDYEKCHFVQKDDSYDMTTNVVRITTLMKKKYHIKLNNTWQMFGDHMVILPFDYLCAKSYETGEIQKSADTFTIHHFAGSWLSESDKLYGKQISKYQKRFPWLYKMNFGKLIIKAAVAYQTGGMALLIRKAMKKYWG